MLRSLLFAPPARAAELGPALARKGFRPFFALAAAHAALAVPAWLAVLGGYATAPAGLDPVSLHVHEMIFGFAVAVVAGFLLTAAANWTRRETLVGAPLLALAGLWTLGRIAMLSGAGVPAAWRAAVDVAFLPALAVVVGRPIVATRSRRNYGIVAILGALTVANVVVHLDALGVATPGLGRRALGGALDLVTSLMLLVAARVVPGFTRNATQAQARSRPALDVATMAAMGLVLVLDVATADPRPASLAAGLAGLLAFARAASWGARHTAREPLLWVLHVGHAWLALGLVLRGALAVWPVASGALALHAVTVGGLGSLTLGMMVRVALGHTGRLLRAPRSMGWAFGAMSVATVARMTPALDPARTPTWLGVAGAAWSFAFGAYLVALLPVLTAPRVDGRPG